MPCMLRCDECDRALGTYLHGNGGALERSNLIGFGAGRLPDLICFVCLKLHPERGSL
jgi:hypothetical protein